MALPEVGRQTGDNENTREDIFKEIDILVGMEHENVIFMKEYFEENNKVSIFSVRRQSVSSSSSRKGHADSQTAI